MPVQTCETNGKQGFKWGSAGKCYTHDGSDAGKKAAKAKAVKQGLAAGGGKLFSLETVDLHEVEIAAADVTVWGNGSPEEGDTYSLADLEKIAADSNAVADDLRAPVKIGHDKKQRLLRASGLWGEEPRSGTLKNFKTKGDKLVCDIVAMPKKLADLVPTAFRLRSMELGAARSQRTNETYDTVVKGLALLGTTTPAFQTLDDIHAMFSESTGEQRMKRGDLLKMMFEDSKASVDVTTLTNYAVGDIVWDEEDGVMDIMRDISEQLNPGSPDSFPSYWVMDLQLVDVDGDGDVPGPRALVGEYGNGAAWVVPFTFAADGEPEVPPSTDWTLAEQAWVEVGTDVPENENGADFEDRDRETSDATDTIGIVKIKIRDNEVELPDLDEKQVKVFAELFTLEGDDIDAEKVYAEMVKRAEAPKEEPKTEQETPKDPPPVAKDFTETKEYAELKERAERGDIAYEEARVEKRDTYLHGLVGKGRLNPADLEFWTKEYDENPVTAKRVLDTLPVNDELYRVYGTDNDFLNAPDNSDEAAYRAYCANQGIPYTARSRSAT